MKIRKIIRSKWTRRCLGLAIIVSYLISAYIWLFEGPANTKVDNVCQMIFFISAIAFYVRSFLIKHWDYKEKKENCVVIGAPGKGHCHHPWDNLIPCRNGCNAHPLLMYGENELYVCGGPYDAVYAICPVCGQRTEKKQLVEAISDWNELNQTWKVKQLGGHGRGMSHAFISPELTPQKRQEFENENL